jgi:hypothetical protein
MLIAQKTPRLASKVTVPNSRKAHGKEMRRGEEMRGEVVKEVPLA